MLKVLTLLFVYSEKPEKVMMDVVDFDGVSYRISTPSSKTQIQLSLKWACWPELVQFGAEDMLKREYAEYYGGPTEDGFDVTLHFDLEKLPEDKEALVKKVSLLKRNIFAAPFERAFTEQEQLEDDKVTSKPIPELMSVHYRDDEAIHIKASQDRVTVIFETTFKEEADRVYGKLFLTEFMEARRRIQSAPPVHYSGREPPLEIRHIQGLKDSGTVGYVTFILFPRHTRGEIREETISRIQIFRDYLHYHIKCSKAYLHSRMRARVAEFLKVLNRAKPENQTGERKLARH
ncbi:hypothetical protein BZG36_00244 [Bifiguratus adelaidae]|uniref:Arp2/3 complex 34 kDa subunit n=1 Tax=Bifiguratus adelaidae TaxID=1938954 RepID=A0A261Y8K4_9FUNG|nr:hypothetical protein BZG36_00244 [Bifiguratus adelaidae]